MLPDTLKIYGLLYLLFKMENVSWDRERICSRVGEHQDKTVVIIYRIYAEPKRPQKPYQWAEQ